MATRDNRKDLNYAIGWSRFGLRILGVFPDPEIPLIELRRLNIRFVVCTVMLLYFIVLPQIVAAARCWGHLEKLAETAMGLNIAATATCKIIMTYYHREVLRDVVTAIYEDWMSPKSSDTREIMLQITHKSKRIFTINYIAVIFTVVFYSVVESYTSYLSRDTAHRHFPYDPIQLYDTQKSPIYELVFAAQIGSSAYSGMVYFSIDSFVSGTLLHICGQLINLRHSINELVADNRENSSEFERGLIAIIRRHQFLIGIVRTLDGCYRWTLLAQTAGATLQLCFVAFTFCNVSRGSSNGAPFLKLCFLVFYVCVLTSHLFMYCYAGDRVLDESIAMRDGAYNCKWYDLIPGKAKNLMMITFGSNIPLHLSIGKFGVFSLEMFGAILKMSMGYLSVLLTLKDQDD